MSGRPRVTVVVPIFNAERYLRECVESVLGQEYGEWELMLVDDGSTDGSAGMASEFAASHPSRIHFLRHEGGANRGSSESRNLGALRGSAELIAFLDADDTWYPYTLREQVAVMDAHPKVGFVYARALLWHEWAGGSDPGMNDSPSELGVPTDRVLPSRQLLEMMLPRTAAAPLMGTLMVRRSVFDDAGGFENTFTGMYDDQVLVAKSNLVSSSYAVDRVWSRYRQHPDSMYAVARSTGRKNESRLAYLGWLKSTLEARDRVAESRLRGLVNAELLALTAPRTRAGLPRQVAAVFRRVLRRGG